MSKEYFWWDLEGSRLKGVIYDSINSYFLCEHPYKNWSDFSKADPHMAYAQLVYERFNALEQQFVDLRVIPQLLGVNDIPLKSSVMNINRYDWIKSILDLTLFRFSSIRDIVFHLVNEVMNLNIIDYKLNIKNISASLKSEHQVLLTNLMKIEKIGLTLRNDRNERAHKGFSNLHTPDDLKFRNMSWEEDRISGVDLNYLISTYEKSRETIYLRVVNETEQALKSCIEISNELYESYRDKHHSLSIGSKSGISGHFKNYHWLKR